MLTIQFGAIQKFFASMFVGLLVAMPWAAIAGPNLPVPQPRQAEDEEGDDMLSEAQVNLIKVYEIHLDTEPRITVPTEVREAFLDEHAESNDVPRGAEERRNFIRRAEGWEVLRVMFRVRARSYYPQVTVEQEPDPLRTWRRSLHGSHVAEYFLRHFANKPIEGVEILYQGNAVDQIPLFVRGGGRDSDRIAYTNLYILTQTTVNGVPIIDRDSPAESLLLQWALPREDARYAAPEVEGWRPRFRSTQHERYNDVLNWIESLIDANDGSNYGLRYVPPQFQHAAGDQDD